MSEILFENKVLMLKKWLQTTQPNNPALQMKKHGLEVTQLVSKRARIQVPIPVFWCQVTSFNKHLSSGYYLPGKMRSSVECKDVWSLYSKTSKGIELPQQTIWEQSRGAYCFAWQEQNRGEGNFTEEWRYLTWIFMNMLEFAGEFRWRAS